MQLPYPLVGLCRMWSLFETVARYLQEQVKLVLGWSFAEWGNRKALRLKAQGVYFCK